MFFFYLFVSFFQQAMLRVEIFVDSTIEIGGNSDEKKNGDNDGSDKVVISIDTSMLLLNKHVIGFTQRLLNCLWNDIQFEITFLLQSEQEEWQNNYSLYCQDKLIKQAVDLGEMIEQTKCSSRQPKIQLRIKVKCLLFNKIERCVTFVSVFLFLLMLFCFVLFCFCADAK